MIGVVGAGVALVAFLFAAILQLSGTDPQLQGFIAYLGFAGIALALLDHVDRPQR